MTTGAQVCHPEDTLADATARIWKAESDPLPVVDWQNRIIGQLSAREVEVVLERTGRTAEEVQVSEALSHDVTGCFPNDKITDAVRVMRESGLAQLPVIDADRQFLGTLSLGTVAGGQKAPDAVETS
jgi:predicted transcriptional regulator